MRHQDPGAIAAATKLQSAGRAESPAPMAAAATRQSIGRAHSPGAIPAAAAVASAGLAFHQIFPWRELLPALATAASIPLLIATAAKRRPAWQSLLASALAWALLIGPAVFHGVPAPSGILRGLRDGWHTILTTVLPLPHRPELLVVAFTASWIAAAAAAELAIRTEPAAAPAVPPIALLVLAGLLGAGGPDRLVVLTLIAVATTAAAMLSTAARARPKARRRSASDHALRLGAIAAATAVAFAAAPHLPLIADATPYDPKREVTPPPAIEHAVSPLDEANSWLTQPDRELFTVRTTQGVPWRLAVFDHFDGASWSSSARWEPTGGRVPSAPEILDAAGPTLQQTVTISGLTGPWLPAAERPTDVSGLDVSVDPASGVIVAATPLKPGQTYLVRSTPDTPAQDRLRTAPVAHDAEAQAALQLPTTDSTGQSFAAYQDLLNHAATATDGATTPFQQASMLEQYLRTEEHYDESAPTGYSYRSLQDFLDTTHRGTTVQTATAFVVMARTLGLPSRVAVGFQPGTRDGDTWHVTTGDVMAWPEVDFQGLGWIPFWPTPDGAATAPAAPSLPTGLGDDPSKTDGKTTAAAPPPPHAGTTDPASATTAHAAPKPSVAQNRWPWFGAIAAGIFVLYLAVIPTAPARRRRRRSRAKTPAARIAGAWQQAVERMPIAEAARVEKQRRSPLTTSEFARLAEATLGPEAQPHLTALATLADAAGYAALEPDATAAEAAWRHCSALEAMARRHLGWPRRCARRLAGRV